MITEREALDHIDALVVEAEERQRAQVAPARIKATEVRAVLAEVTPEPGGTLDREKARDALIWMQQNGGIDMYGWDDCLDRLAACVRPATIDRDELTIALNVLVASDRHDAAAVRATVDHIFALVRPVAGGSDAEK